MRAHCRQIQLLVARHKRYQQCIICNDRMPENATQYTHKFITNTQIQELFMKHNILLRPGRRYCNKLDVNHIIMNLQDLANNIPTQPISDESLLSYKTTITLIHYANKTLNDKYDKKVQESNDHKCKISFNHIGIDHCKHIGRLSRENIMGLSNRYLLSCDDLLLFYSICFKNNSGRFLEPVFGISDTKISSVFRRVLRVLKNNFVPTQLNRHWDRELINQNTPDFVKHLYEMNHHQILLLTDGTLIEVGKSGNFDHQKREYSHYKKKNCLTFMPVTTANGRYVMCLGPFNSDGDNNDASIYNAATDIEYLQYCDNNRDADDCIFDDDTIDNLLYFNQQLFCNSDDIMAADRGYYDSTFIDDRLQIPSFLNPPSKNHGRRKKKKRSKRKQLTTAEATRTRKVLTFATFLRIVMVD